MGDTASRVRTLLERYDTADACAARLLCDDHPADAVAFTVVDADLSSTDLTYGELRERSARFAAALADLGVEPGDHVATLMGKSADLVVAVLGIWRRGAVHVPLFTAFAPPAIAFRLDASGTKVVVADRDQAGKLAAGSDLPPRCRGRSSWPAKATRDASGRGGRDFGELIAAQSADDPRGEAVAVGARGVWSSCSPPARPALPRVSPSR